MSMYNYSVSKTDVSAQQDSANPLVILQLNDDCLIKIFSYLNNYQLVNMLGICEQFDEIIDTCLRRCKSLSFNFRFFESDSKNLFMAAGPHLTSFEFSFGYSISTELVIASLEPIVHCKKLKKLTLNYLEMCEEYMELITNISDHLEKIDFSFCLLTDEVMSEFFKWHCSSLKDLTLLGNYTFVGDSLVYLRNLNSFTMEDHDNFNMNNILEIKANNPKAEIVVYEKGRSSIVDVNL